MVACGEDDSSAASTTASNTTTHDGGGGAANVTKDAGATPPSNPAPAAYPADWNVTFTAARPLPDDYEFGHRVTTLAAGTTYGMQTLPLPCDVVWERDIPVTLRDGTVIYTDTLSPTDTTLKAPALVAWSPYGKALPGRSPTSVPLDWYSGVSKFEGPDAAFWVCNGYVVVNPDVRGAYKSEGKVHSFGSVDAADGYDVIEWIATQTWSNGNVGMHGASWLSIAEWFVASTRPPHLKAIAPWNGQSDLYRNSLAQGGIPDTAFGSMVGSILVSQTGVESTVSMLKDHPFIDDYWDDKRAKVEDITAPAYVGADIATALHTAGTLDAFRRLGSKDKWLRVNDTNEWYDQYTPDNLKDLQRFFDHYLKGSDNDWESTPRVRVAVMDPGTGGEAKVNTPYDAWPVSDTSYQQLYLNAKDASLVADAPSGAAEVSYDAASGETSFTFRFTEDTQVVGHPMARLFVEAKGADDMDVFVLIEKLDEDGSPLVPSELAAMYFPKPPPGVPGRLRASMRALDEGKSSDYLPVYAFKSAQKLKAGEVVQLDIALMPTAMRWHAGQQLRLTVAGSYVKGPGLPLTTLNEGTHVVHSGAGRASYLRLPVVEWTR